MRFDEVELESVSLGTIDEQTAPVLAGTGEARRDRRMLALLTDFSLFAALVLAMSPLLPQPPQWTHLAALGGFVVVLSYYYFVVMWMLWGKTIGGTIFDVRVVPDDDGAMALRNASMRWAGVWLSVALCGLGFMLAALPARRSLPDRMSGTHCA
jgi:uncharacterized RDD family membrane protein YckC